jgi:DNA repair exonuclease SbcCD ATPase subunit
MNLLRQKIAQLQQEKEARSALAVERDEAHLAMRKLEKKLERMQKELSACQEHNTELKAKLADTNELKASGGLLPLLLSAKVHPSTHKGRQPVCAWNTGT